MNKQYSIEELCEEVNKKIMNYLQSNNYNVTDSRQSQELSVRRIRDYITDKVITPKREGKNTYFTQEDIETLYNARLMNYSGISQKYLKTISSQSVNIGSAPLYGATSASLEDTQNINNIFSAIEAIENRGQLNKPFIKTINYSEYEVKKGIFIKIDNNQYNNLQIQEILQKISKQINN